MKKHILLPDMQVTPDAPTDHMDWVGEYMLEQKPDEIIDIGDFADMESLSSYDQGKRQFEGRRYIRDIDAAYKAMERLLKPIKDHNVKKAKWKDKQYKPGMHLTLGNHEYRIQRAIDSDAKLDGTLGLNDLEFESFGWKVYPFTDIAIVDEISYSHYFYNPMTGRPYGGENIKTRLKNIGFSFTMGHQQGMDSGRRTLNNGDTIRGLIAGSCYLHDEDYIGPQGNGHWRGIIVKHEVCRGNYDLMEVSLDYLCRKYEGMHVWEFMKKKYPKIFTKSLWMQAQERRAA